MNEIVLMFIISFAVAVVTNIAFYSILDYIAKRKIQRDIVDAFERAKRKYERKMKEKETDK